MEGAPYPFAALVFLGVLAIYVVTIAPSTQFWDTAEYISAAKVLGIPHPPGNPLFVVLANVWGMIPLAEHYALRMNLFAAITGALSSAFLFLAAEQFLRGIIPQPRWARLLTAAAGVLVGATANTVSLVQSPTGAPSCNRRWAPRKMIAGPTSKPIPWFVDVRASR